MIRLPTLQERVKVLTLAKATEFFDVDEMQWLGGIVDQYLAGDLSPDNTWLVDEAQGDLLATAYFAHDGSYEEAHQPGEEGHWNLYFIGVRPDLKGQGRGGALLRHIEAHIAGLGGQRLYIETSGLPAFEATRGFYHKHAYTQDKVVKDAYGPGDDKVVFVKNL